MSQNRLPPPLPTAWLLPPSVYLFILPFTHTIALRWLAALLTLAVAIWQWRRGMHFSEFPCKGALAFWAVCLLVSVVGAADTAGSAAEFKVDVIYSLAMFLAFYTITQSAREFEAWLFALATGSFAISLLAIAYWAWFGEWELGYQNARGEFATCMITALPLILLLSLRDMPWTRGTVVVKWILPFMLAAGLLTLSRMFLGALVLMLLVAAGLEAARHRLSLRLGLMVAAIASALAATAILAVTEERGVNFGDDMRPAIWNFAWQRIKQHPWIGTGYGSMSNRHDYIQAFPDLGIFHPHNLLLAYAEQAGVLGVLAIVAVFLALGREYWRLYRSDTVAASHVGVAGLAMLIGVFTKNMTDMFFTHECALLFWSLNGALLGFGRRSAAASATGYR